MRTTITTTALTALIAAGIDLNEQFPGGLDIVPDTAGAVAVTADQPKAEKEDGRNHAARKHNYEARIARRTDKARKGGAGMTKAEKSALYRDLQGELGRVPTVREWNAACKKVRFA